MYFPKYTLVPETDNIFSEATGDIMYNPINWFPKFSLSSEDKEVIPEAPPHPEHVGVMRLSALMGALLLKNGGEIYRVQDTLNRVIDACGFPNHSVYVLSNGVFITINEGEPNACSSVRHVPLGAVNLNRIAQINQVSRDLCEGRIDRDTAYATLLEYEKPYPVNPYKMILASGFAAAGFGILFGGSLLDATFGFVNGMLLQLVLDILSIQHVTKFPSFIISSLFVTLLSGLVLMVDLPFSFNQVVIASIFPLVPGYSLTASIRELFNGDYLSGMIHLLDALVTAFSIAVGVGMGIRLIQMMGGGMLL